MFGWFKRRSERRHAEASFRESLVGRMLARYDAAVANDENKKHWANADALSSVGANSRAVRTVLRNRSRYEVANNSYANGMVRTLAYHCVGTGPTLSIEGEEPFDREVEQRFEDWAGAINLADKLRTMREARARDGEAFALLTTNRGVDDPVKLDLALVEADQIGDPGSGSLYGANLGAEATRNYCDGITYDDAGNPVSYEVLNCHPGDPYFEPGSRKVDASFVFHWFRTDRPGQRRGIPELTPALPLYAILRRYTLAVVSSAEIAALMSLFLKTTSPAIDPASVDPYDLIEVQRNSMMTLPDGWDVQQLKAEQPTTSFDAFVRTMLREIARCLDMPFNVAAGDSSSYNYSSGRLDHQTYFRAIEVDRHSLERAVLDRVFRAWLDEALLTPGLFIERRTTLGRPRAGWDWPPFEHVDPEKESKATANDLSFALTSIPTEHARRGRRWEREFARQARALGITVGDLQRRVADKLFATSTGAPGSSPDNNGSAEDDKQPSNEATT